jgi:hypothetical protein
MTISSDIKNRIERELKRMKADPSTKGKRAAEIILAAGGSPVHHKFRGELEQFLAEGISPNRLEDAIRMVAEHLRNREANPQ